MKNSIGVLPLIGCLALAGCSQKYSDLTCEELARVKASEDAKAAASEAALQRDGKPSDAEAMKAAEENVANAHHQQREKKCLASVAGDG